MAFLRRKVRFQVRTLLAGISICAVLMAIAVKLYYEPWQQDQRCIKSMSEVGGQVFTEPRGQFLIRQIVGDRFSERAVYVHLSDKRVDDTTLATVAEMQHVEVLSIKSPSVTDAGLVHLQSLSNLRDLNLVDTQVTEAGVQQLRRALPRLQLIERR